MYNKLTMKANNNINMLKAINKSTEKLHQKIDMQQCLIAAILEQKKDDASIKQFSLPLCSYDKSKFKEAIVETINVLEESRKAFKSKSLETLRKKLTQILIESK